MNRVRPSTPFRPVPFRILSNVKGWISSCTESSLTGDCAISHFRYLLCCAKARAVCHCVHPADSLSLSVYIERTHTAYMPRTSVAVDLLSLYYRQLRVRASDTLWIEKYRVDIGAVVIISPLNSWYSSSSGWGGGRIVPCYRTQSINGQTLHILSCDLSLSPSDVAERIMIWWWWQGNVWTSVGAHWNPDVQSAPAGSW